LLAASLLGACAAPPTNVRSDAPPLVTAGITDRRNEFAALFEQALGERKAARWLHGVASPAGQQEAATRRQRFAARATSTVVLVVPGLFGDCVAAQSVPFGDGVMRDAERNRTEAYRQYDDLGPHALRLVALPGRHSAAANGRLLAEAIRSEAAQPGIERIVLVAYSKGTTDALHALELLREKGALPTQPTALVSVAGLVHGSLVVERHAALYEALAPGGEMFGCTASDGHELADLSPPQRAAWLAAHPLPRGPRYYSIVAHAAQDETALPLRPFHAELAAVDLRNDGQLIARNALLPGSELLAEAHTDHWGVALPLDRHPWALVRTAVTPHAYPREALLRATLWWVIGER
jgi:hypothetical protein